MSGVDLAVDLFERLSECTSNDDIDHFIHIDIIIQNKYGLNWEYSIEEVRQHQSKIDSSNLSTYVDINNQEIMIQR